MLGFGLLGLQAVQAQQVMPLYNGKIPGAKAVPADYRQTETKKDGKVIALARVSSPTLTMYRPAPGTANGTSVIICPGGGYGHLAVNHEGDEVARRFAAKGVTAFVLVYRLPEESIMEDQSLAPLQDAEQAMYQVRRHAAEWGLDTAKVGIMGFSAGGHLASSLAVHYRDSRIANAEGLSLRPAFAVLIYPVVSFLASPHTGSVKNLIGAAGTQAQREYFSNERHVDAQTPASFLVHANDDPTVPVENSILFNQALVRQHVPVETHLYQAGGHGFGLHNKTTADEWFDRLMNWMQQQKLLGGS